MPRSKTKRVVIIGGHVFPWLLLALQAFVPAPRAGVVLLLGAVALSYLPRLLAIRRFQQSPLGVLLHPLGVTVLLAIQWYALGRNLLGRPATWMGRPNPGPRERLTSRVPDESVTAAG